MMLGSCRSIPAVRLGALCVLLLQSACLVWAYPTGAGGCNGGMPAVQSLHLINPTNGTLAEGQLQVSINRQPISPDQAVPLTPGKYEIRLDSISNGVTFRGVLFRMQGNVTIEPNDHNLQEAIACTVNQPDDVVGVTHTSNSDKTSASATFVVEALGTIALDVTSVIRVSPSQFYWSPFSLQIVVTGTGVSPAPVARSPAPTRAPTTTAPTTRTITPPPSSAPTETVIPSIVPTSTPTMTIKPEPSLDPSTVPQISDSPSDSPSVVPTISPEPTIGSSDAPSIIPTRTVTTSPYPTINSATPTQYSSHLVDDTAAPSSVPTIVSMPTKAESPSASRGGSNTTTTRPTLPLSANKPTQAPALTSQPSPLITSGVTKIIGRRILGLLTTTSVASMMMLSII